MRVEVNSLHAKAMTLFLFSAAAVCLCFARNDMMALNTKEQNANFRDDK